MIPKNALNNDDEAKKEFDKIEEIEKTINREELVYKATEYTYDFRDFITIRTFSRDIYEGIITLEEADNDQSNLLNEIRNFKDKTRPQNDKKKKEKEIVLKNLYNFFEAREKVLNGFSSKAFLVLKLTNKLDLRIGEKVIKS